MEAKQRRHYSEPDSVGRGGEYDDENNMEIKSSTEESRKLQYFLEQIQLLHAQLRSTTNKATYSRSPSFIKNGTLRNHQIEGFNWLISLYNNNINGILADEMGLGKTLQTISMLGYLKSVKKINGAFLIIVPKSTISGWMNEIKKWCPSLRAFALVGYKDERNSIIKNVLSNQKKWDVCLTTYEICCRNKSNLKKIDWKYFVVDEAHRLKNENSLFSKTLREYRSDHRLLLTGTPFHNNLHELWALLNYQLPDLFHSADEFDSMFNTSDIIENGKNLNALQTVLKPFILQRSKEEVEKSLLPKQEITLFIPLSKLQIEWYKKVLLKNIHVIKSSGHIGKMRLDFLIVHLLKCASHPYILPGAEPEPHMEGEHLVNNSGKMIVLDKLLKKLKAEGSRVVIFCQFTTMLNILADYCTMRQYSFFFLDGNTSYENREKDIEAFNAKGSQIFLYLISTTAGGLGINLQTADVVILFQSHWNPQVDLQAMDRVHRIGQKKQVRIFRFISHETIEENLIEIAQRKLKLNHKVTKNQGESAMNDNELGLIVSHFKHNRMMMRDTIANEPIIKEEHIDIILKQIGNLKSYRFDENNNDNNNNSDDSQYNWLKCEDPDLESNLESDEITMDSVAKPKRRCRKQINYKNM